MGKRVKQVERSDEWFIKQGPRMYELLREAVVTFEDAIKNDEPINGADAIDWLVRFVKQAKKAIKH